MDANTDFLRNELVYHVWRKQKWTPVSDELCELNICYQYTVNLLSTQGLSNMIDGKIK